MYIGGGVLQLRRKTQNVDAAHEQREMPGVRVGPKPAMTASDRPRRTRAIGASVIGSFVVSSLFALAPNASAQPASDPPATAEPAKTAEPTAAPAPAPHPAPGPAPAPPKPDGATPADPRVRPVEPGEGQPTPAAPDDRTGHVYLRAGSALVLPAGSIRSDVAANAVVGPGAGFIGGLGVGLSRHVELDVLATYALMQGAGGTGGGACTDCAGNHFSGSLGLVYHLAQGAALDPWMRFGTGYRTADYEGKSIQLKYLVPGRFHGWDIAQISLGATFFPARGFGFGPFLEGDIGTYLKRPSGGLSPAGGPTTDAGGPRTYAFFQLGLRVEIDPVSWARPSKAPTKPSSTARSAFPSF